MDKEGYSPAVAAARRRAKAHSRATGDSHQASLDHVARMAGKSGWGEFLADPAEPKVNAASRVRDALKGSVSRRLRLWSWGIFGLVTSSVVVLVAEAARHGAYPGLHVPIAVEVAYASVWTCIVALWLWLSADAVLSVRHGSTMVDASAYRAICEVAMALVMAACFAIPVLFGQDPVAMAVEIPLLLVANVFSTRSMVAGFRSGSAARRKSADGGPEGAA